MAGGGNHQPLKLDPSIERWSQMRENVYQHFSFTKRATRNIVMWAAVFPAFVAGVAYVYDNKYDWAGKMKGSSLQAGKPAIAATPATEE